MAFLLRRVPTMGRAFTQRTTAVSTRFFSEKVGYEPKSAGARDGEVPDEIEQTTGKSYEEYVLEEEGRRRFNRGALIGPFGTQEKPTMVLSAFDERIVGCVGPKDDEHDVNWFMLKKDQKTLCVLCGQFFQLTNEPVGDVETDVPEE